MQVTVTKTHISQGVPHDPCKCPIALAVKETLPIDYRVSVGHSSISTYQVERRGGVESWHPKETYILPIIASEFVYVFDETEYPEAIEPITFDAPLWRESPKAPFKVHL